MKKPEIFVVIAFVLLQVYIVSMMVRMGEEKPFVDRQRIANATVCPPFFLYDEDDNLINPVKGINTDRPYSPKQTCGKCHDYDLITSGYHFQQGRDEEATGVYAERYQWVSHPGNYGGNWCSPAPLYRYLSPRENTSARTIDMTSFSFITAGCGNCHPGGGPTEYDRMGKRYDHYMLEKGYESGGINDLDGDYYQARWVETGVLEGDCMLCHGPGYDNDGRLKQLKELNFRWASLAGTSWAKVSGSVSKNEPVSIDYDLSYFDSEGKLSPTIIREPRNEACLFCHAQPGWKKRGANFSVRTDVHLRAGMKCVDCHPAGSMAMDERINQREMHQFGKGDDPGGKVRDDLDHSMITCKQCHDTGHMGAPVAKHYWLPALHLDRIACQTCHIPERFVKPAQVQASDVFNTGTKISTPGKHLWVFYGPDMNYYNHYGNLEMMGYDDKPTDIFRPIYIRYKGLIYPANRVHSTWPGIEVEGKPGLMQPKMGDIYKMWQDHFNDPSKYPELALIEDDNQDGVLEINRPEEIDALIQAVSSMLQKMNYPMEGKRVVWVMNGRVYRSGNEFYTIEKEAWEASPYANVHTYNHDIFPARAALGINGCSDCHSSAASFFSAQVLEYPFSEENQPVYVAQNEILGISKTAVLLGNFRESLLKPLAPWIIISFVLLLILHFVMYGKNSNSIQDDKAGSVRVARFKLSERLLHYILMLSFVILGFTGFLFFLGKSDPSAPWVRDFHVLMGWLLIVSLVMILLTWFRQMLFSKSDKVWLKSYGGYFGNHQGHLPAGKFNAGQKLFFWMILLWGFILACTGILLSRFKSNIEMNLSLIYTIHDIAALIVLILVLAHVYLGIVLNPESTNSIFGGYVSEEWVKAHHSEI